MGITMVALDAQVVQELQSRHQLPLEVNHGILVFRMVQDSPADQAGIRPGMHFLGRTYMTSRPEGGSLGLNP